MKTAIVKMCIGIVTSLFIACGSGQKSPTDSHPGSGSVKEDSDPDDSKAIDTTKSDSTTNTYKE